MSAEDFSSDEEVESHQYKVILLGDGSVGKTSITSRFAHDAFQMQYKQTVGVDFALGHIILPGECAAAGSPEWLGPPGSPCGCLL